MKNAIKFFLTTTTVGLLFTGCEKILPDEIIYHSENKEYEYNNDSAGVISIDLNGDSRAEISFGIINLQERNGGALPPHFDTLAAIVNSTIDILDNSTYGYPDALNSGDPISKKGKWDTENGVLGTFIGAGQFQGKGEKYLAFRLPDKHAYKYGWIKIDCSEHNNILKIIDYAYNNTAGNSITAGQKN